MPESTDTYTRIFAGSAGGNLVATAGDARSVTYRLDPDHRAYLFGSPLEGDGAGDGTRIALLPASGEIAQTVPLPDRDWYGVRIYDRGGCSKVLTWEQLAVQVGGLVVGEIIKSDLIRDLEVHDVELEPILEDSPGLEAPLLGPRPALDRARLTLRMTGIATGCAGTPSPGIEASGVVRIGLADAYVPLQPGLDIQMALVGCDPPDERDDEYVCRIPFEEDGVIRVEERRYDRFPSGVHLFEDDYQMARVSCSLVEREYQCVVPSEHAFGEPRDRESGPGCGICGESGAVCDFASATACPERALPGSLPALNFCGLGNRCVCSADNPGCLQEGDPCDGSACPRGQTCERDGGFFTCYEPASEAPIDVGFATFERQLRFIPGAKDLEFELVGDVEADVGFCPFLGPFLNIVYRRILDSVINSSLGGSLDDAAGRVGSLIEGMSGDDAIEDHGVDPAALPTCRGDLDCIDPDPRRRYNAVCEGGLCRQRVVEIRRVNLLPEGLEFIFSEGPGDPQHGAAMNYAAIVAEASPITVPGALGLACGEEREPALSDEDEPEVSVLEAERPSTDPDLSPHITGEVCDPASPEPCNLLCAERGARCRTPADTDFIFRTGLLPAPICRCGQCASDATSCSP